MRLPVREDPGDGDAIRDGDGWDGDVTSGVAAGPLWPGVGDVPHPTCEERDEQPEDRRTPAFEEQASCSIDPWKSSRQSPREV
jgi:hypothetical protein